MIPRLLLAAFILTISLTAARAEMEEFWRFNVLGWEGGAYKLESGGFSHCYIASVYKSEITLGFGLTAANELRVMLGKETWRLPKGASYDVGLFVDDRAIGRFPSTVYDPQYLTILIGKRTDIFQRLRAGYLLRVSAAREDFFFNLDGTSRALEKMRECVSIATAFSNPDSNPFAANKGTGQASNPFSSHGESYSQSDQEILESLLLASGLQEVTFVEPKDLALDGASYAWVSGEITGAVFRVDPEGSSIDTFVNDVLGTYASSCQGTFGSQSPVSEYVGGRRIKQFSAACRMPGYDDEYYVGTALGDRGVALIFIAFSNTAPEQLRTVNDSLGDLFLAVLSE